MKKISGIVLLTLMISCSRTSETTTPVNSEEKTFDVANSDPAAVELADTIASAAGGIEQWKKIRFIQWSEDSMNFFWDKAANNVRIESPRENTISIINLTAIDGQLSVDGRLIPSDDASYQERMKEEYEKWISSSAKIFLPFTLKTPGVSLKYLGEEELENIGECNVLLIEPSSGDRNYKAFVSLKDNLIKRLQVVNPADSVLRSLSYNDYQANEGIRFSIPEPSEIHNLKVGVALNEKLFTEL